MADTTRTQVNVPLTAEERQAVQEAAKARGISQAEFLRQAAQSAMMEDLAAAIPEQGDAIAEFRMMLDKIMGCYQSALEHSKNAYDLAAAKVKDDLSLLGSTIRDNQELKARVAELEEDYTRARDEVQNMMDYTVDIQTKDKEIERLQEENDELKRALLDSEKKLLEVEKKHAAELEADRKIHQDELIASIVRVMQGQGYTK